MLERLPFAADFAAGVILYQLLTGDKPFTGSVTTIIQKVLRQEPLAPSELNPTLSPAWDRVVARAMAKKPEARFESAARRTAGNARKAGGRGNKRVPAMAVVILVSVAVIGGAVYIQKNSEDQTAKAESTRIAAESRARDEADKRAAADKAIAEKSFADRLAAEKAAAEKAAAEKAAAKKSPAERLFEQFMARRRAPGPVARRDLGIDVAGVLAYALT